MYEKWITSLESNKLVEIEKNIENIYRKFTAFNIS